MTQVTPLLRLLRNLCEADAAILVRRELHSGGYAIYRVSAAQDDARPPTWISDGAAAALFDLPEARLANLLEAEHVVTVPLRRQQQIAGRLYLSAGRAFTPKAQRLLAEAADNLAAVVDSHAVLRSRISHDIHDTAIQPYIGLKLGLEALYRKLDPASPTAARLKELLEATSVQVGELRAYVEHLRGEAAWADEPLPQRLRLQAERFRALWGLEVELHVEDELQLSGDVAAQAYQLACEALSNVCRHTRATRAFVNLLCRDASLVLEVGNERGADSPTQPFAPRTLAERAAALGGEVEVSLDSQGHDVVRVCVPMRGAA